MKTLLIKPLVVLLFFLCIAMQLLGQQQRKRLALVIGNAAYQHGGALKNPVNDADLMARTLEDLGFDVIKETDAGLKDMQSAFKGFVTRLDDYGVALFFYAGHGMQVDGQNYLIPVDARLEDKLSVEFEAFKVSSVNRYFAFNDDKLNIMILDACRNNPYRAWMRGGGQGFNAIEDQGAGTIIAFATREGETASDGTGSNGLFTQHLVEQMRIPQNITDVFQNTRVSVLKASKKQQVPQEWNMLTGNFYFTHTASGQSANEDAGINDNPVFVSGKVSVDYGSIMIDTKIGGDLYLDGEILGYLQANSTGNQLNKIKTGAHTVKIVGSETQTREITVYKDRATTVIFEKKIEGYTTNVASASFTDSRDRKIYKLVRIGNQVWMAENLDYGMPSTYVSEKGDRYYTWEAAMKACPAGWHLPSDMEWDILVNRFGGSYKAGTALKSASGWKDGGNGTNSSGFTGVPGGNGTNSSGFTGLPGGARFSYGDLVLHDRHGFWWSSSESSTLNAWNRELYYVNDDVFRGNYFKGFGFSVRCLRD